MSAEIQRLYKRTIGCCTKCQHTGHIRGPKGLSACECRVRFGQWSKFEHAKIPEIYWDKNWKDYTAPDRATYSRVVEYYSTFEEQYNRGAGLYLWGDFGIGKSGLLAEVLKGIAAESTHTVAFLFFPDVIHTLSSFDTVEASERDKMTKMLTEVDFLVLDDVGREYRKEGSNWVGSNIDQYFRARMNRKLPTLMSSNFSLNKTKDFYGGSILSVFRGSMVELRVEGEDFRSIEGQQKRAALEEGL